MIRRAMSSDIPALITLRGAVRENRLSDPSRVTRADIEWFIAHGPVHVWLGQDGILGFSASDPRDGSIWALFVDPAHEGCGIGQALLKAACDSAAAAGHTVLRLSTDPGTRAARFYARNGWMEQGMTAQGEVAFTKAL